MTHDLYRFRHIIKTSTSLEPTERPEITQIRGQFTFINQSTLHIRENYITASNWVDYSYHWQTADHQLIRRWDNAHEIPYLATSPYHQHVGLEDNVQSSEPMTLDKVLVFIANQLTSD